MRIHRTLTGKVLDLGGGTVSNEDVGQNGLNATSHVEWKLTVPPGLKKEVTYTYETYSAMGK